MHCSNFFICVCGALGIAMLRVTIVVVACVLAIAPLDVVILVLLVTLVVAIKAHLLIFHWLHMAHFSHCRAQKHCFRPQSPCSLAFCQGLLLFQFIHEFHKTKTLSHTGLLGPKLPWFGQKGQMLMVNHATCQNQHLESPPYPPPPQR